MKYCLISVLNKSKDKIPKGAVYVGRPSKWGSVRGKVGGWTAPMSSEDEHCIGFLAVYNTYEAAIEDAESADLVMEIRESIRA